MKKILVYTILILALLVIIYSFLKRFHMPLPAGRIESPLPAKYAEAALKKPNSYLIKNVSIIPMNKDTVLQNHSVLIEDGRIKQISVLSGKLDTSSNPRQIDGAGKYLIPGLNDMHVHVNDENNLLLFIANGVTTVRNMAGFDFHLALREKIGKQTMLGPTLYSAGPILEGVDQVWKFSIPLRTKNQARDAVKKYKKEGYDFIKVYHTLSESVYREILRVADSIEIPVAGHLPFQVSLDSTLALTQYSIEHVDLRPISPHLPLNTREEMIGRSKKWMCPTLVVYRNTQKSADDPSLPFQYEQYIDDDTKKFWKFRFRKTENTFELQKKMAKSIYQHGGRFVTGTDCLNSYVLAGFSLHEELEEMVSAGIPEYEVLKASTAQAATFLKRQDIGTIAPGNIADLVLLDGNPLKDIRNTRTINGVMVRGKWFDATELESMLEDVKNIHSNSKN